MAKSTVRSIVAVEFGPAFLKLVEFLPLENQISMVVIKPLDVSQWGNDDYLRDQIRTTLSKHVSGKSVDLVSSIPAGNAILRTIEIPMSEDNPLDALQWDMEQYLTKPLDDYFMDYQAIGSNADETGRLYLVAAFRRNQVERTKQLLESTGYPLVVLDVDAFATINAFETNYPELQSGKSLLIKADAQALACVRCQQGMFMGCEVSPVDSSILDLNGQAKTDKLLDLVAEVRARFDSAHDQWGDVDNVLLCGDFALDAEFRELLESNISVPMVTLDAFKAMAFALSPEQSEQFRPSAPQCAGVLGLALRRGGDC